MERRKQAEAEELRLAATRERNRAEREYNEDLQRKRESAFDFYSVSQGMPREVFLAEIWPTIRSQIIRGEEADQTRWMRANSDSIF